MKYLIIFLTVFCLFVPLNVFGNSHLTQDNIHTPDAQWINQVENFWHESVITNDEYNNFLTYMANNDIISEDYFYQEISDIKLNEKISLKNPNFSIKKPSRNTITYSYEIPLYADEKVVYSAVESAFSTWELLNHKLNYEHVDSGGDIIVKFDKNVLDDTLGYTMLYCFNDCVIYASLGAHDCNGKWSHITKESLRDTMMHEIGHTLGLVHSSNEQNLMFSYGVQTEDIFYDLGYRLPQRIESETYTIGEIKTIDDINNAHDRIEKALKEYGLTIKDYFENGKRTKDPSFDNKLVPLINEYNVLIEKINCQYANHGYKINPYEFLR